MARTEHSFRHRRQLFFGFWYSLALDTKVFELCAISWLGEDAAVSSKHRAQDVTVGIVVFMIGVFFALESLQLTKVAKPFPLMCSIAVATLGMIQVGVAALGKVCSISRPRVDRVREVLVWCWMASTAAFILLFGFYLGAVLSTYIYFQYINRLPLVSRLVVSVGFGLFLYAAFGWLFAFRLPTGVLWE